MYAENVVETIGKCIKGVVSRIKSRYLLVPMSVRW